MDFPLGVRWTTDPYLEPVGGHRFGRKANMKTRAITVLSLVGVLTAGSAAAMVNTRVLNKETSPAKTESFLSVTGLPVGGAVPATAGVQSSPSPTAAANASASSIMVRPLTISSTPASIAQKSSGSQTSSSGPTTTEPVAPAVRLSAFQIGDAGLVRIESGSDEVRVAEIVPGRGWSVIRHTNGATTGTAEVVLQSATIEVTFYAELVGGKVVTRVESKSLTTSGSGGVGGTDDHEEREDDDDEHEEHEDDDHDDDHEGDEDDD